MHEFLKDEATLKLLLLLCAGEGVTINVSALSRQFKKHRNTVKDRINQLYEHKIIEKPIYPLIWLFDEYPLLVISKDEFHRDQKTNSFIEKNPHIFAAFFFKEEAYNTLTVQFHEDLYSYQMWSDSILEEGKIIKEENQHPSDALLFSTKRILKYDPSVPINIIEQGFLNGTMKEISSYRLDSLSVNILKAVLKGEGIRTNENFLARTLNIHRKTANRKIQTLLQERIITKPVARFPRLIVPPDFMLVFSLFEVKRQCRDVEKSMRRDPHIPLLIKANLGRYNYFVASTFNTIEEHLEWQENYSQKFHACIGAIKNTYLSPAMTFSISQNFVSLELLKRKLQLLQGEE
jgi:predicted transcriptional regulator